MSRTLIGLCGSLRAGSLNAAALRLVGQSLPDGFKLEIMDWRPVPIFDADILAVGEPALIVELKHAIREAAGVVIATPEYNFSVPGGLKNTLDWLSRGTDQPFANKPVAMLSAATGPLGGARVQYDLRKVMLFLNAMVLTKPEVFIGAVANKFDDSGQCVDPITRQFVTDQMQAFARWIDQVDRMGL